MSQPCSVFGCDSNRGGETYPTFLLPPNEIIRKLWLRHIPSYIKKPVVCIKHFSESCISRTESVLVNRQMMVYQRTTPKLKPGAVPTIFPEGSGYVRNNQAVIDYPYHEGYNPRTNWQGAGSSGVNIPQGTPGVGTTSIDLPPSNVQSTLLNNQQMRPPMNGYMPINDQVRTRGPSHYVNMYGYNQKLMNSNSGSTPPPPMMQSTLYPDVKFKKLPFYDILGELVKPSTLSAPANREPTANYVFFLTQSQATEIAFGRELGPGTKNEYVVQAQVRFTTVDNVNGEQEDSFPPGCIVKMNSKLVPLPSPLPPQKQGAEPKRPPKPVNVSHAMKINPGISNTLNITWTPDYQRLFCVALFLARKLTSDDLLNRLKSKGVKHKDYTTNLIKEKLSDSDNDIATTVLRVSLICPLGKMRMITPCRSSLCTHMQCFDAGIYISMNEKRATWMCPVCHKAAPYETLVIDGYFQDVLESDQLGDCREILLNKDGSWSAVDESKEPAAASTPKEDEVNEDVQEIKDDDDEDPGTAKQNGGGKAHCPDKSESAKENEVILVDLTDDDDARSAPAAVIKEVLPPPTVPPTTPSPALSTTPTAVSKPLDQAFSDSSNMSANTSVINLDSPSPSPPLGSYNLPSPGVLSPPSSYMCHMRLAPDSRYHPY